MVSLAVCFAVLGFCSGAAFCEFCIGTGCSCFGVVATGGVFVVCLLSCRILVFGIKCVAGVWFGCV